MWRARLITAHLYVSLRSISASGAPNLLRTIILKLYIKRALLFHRPVKIVVEKGIRPASYRDAEVGPSPGKSADPSGSGARCTILRQF